LRQRRESLVRTAHQFLIGQDNYIS
jgi:hypothetical protein